MLCPALRFILCFPFRVRTKFYICIEQLMNTQLHISMFKFQIRDEKLQYFGNFSWLYSLLFKLQIQKQTFSVGHKENTRFLPSAWGYNWATLFLGDINTGTRPSRLGESQVR
jgi:hypothetical protein